MMGIKMQSIDYKMIDPELGEAYQIGYEKGLEHYERLSGGLRR